MYYTDAKVLLRRHQPELVQYIKLESILPYLNQQHLLTDDEYDILLNVMLSERMRKLKLLKFIEGKGPEGFQRFLRALHDEPEHLGHKEITELFTPYCKFLLQVSIIAAKPVLFLCPCHIIIPRLFKCTRSGDETNNCVCSI